MLRGQLILCIRQPAFCHSSDSDANYGITNSCFSATDSNLILFTNICAALQQTYHILTNNGAVCYLNVMFDYDISNTVKLLKARSFSLEIANESVKILAYVSHTHKAMKNSLMDAVQQRLAS